MHAISTLKVKCVHCNSRNLRKKDKFTRQVKHTKIGLRNIANLALVILISFPGFDVVPGKSAKDLEFYLSGLKG